MLQKQAITTCRWGQGIAAHRIPDDIITKLKAQALAPDDFPDPLVYLKLFTPDAQATWWITEWHDEGDGEIQLFGLCDLGLGFAELGKVSLDELKQVRGAYGLPIERDLWWDVLPLSTVMEKHGR